MYGQKLNKYGGDWTKVVEDVRVKRIVLNEQDRIGIGTFQPKDEKNQDSTELTGDAPLPQLPRMCDTTIAMSSSLNEAAKGGMP